MKFVKTDDTITINEFRTAFYQKISAPVDARESEKLCVCQNFDVNATMI